MSFYSIINALVFLVAIAYLLKINLHKDNKDGEQIKTQKIK